MVDVTQVGGGEVIELCMRLIEPDDNAIAWEKSLAFPAVSRPSSILAWLLAAEINVDSTTTSLGTGPVLLAIIMLASSMEDSDTKDCDSDGATFTTSTEKGDAISNPGTVVIPRDRTGGSLFVGSMIQRSKPKKG